MLLVVKGFQDIASNTALFQPQKQRPTPQRDNPSSKVSARQLSATQDVENMRLARVAHQSHELQEKNKMENSSIKWKGFHRAL